jgi:hypothetical protein
MTRHGFLRSLAKQMLRASGAVVLLTVSFGHAAAGDLGRYEPSFWDGLLPRQLFVGPVAPLAFPPPGIDHSLYPLTDDEERLRDQSYALIRPPQQRELWNLLVASFREAKLFPLDVLSFDRMAYANTLIGLPFRSEAGRYSRLIGDVTGDTILLGSFLATACRVVDMDAKRVRSLAHVAGLSELEEGNALARNNENRFLIEWVERASYERAWSYRYAVERLVIAVPSPLAVEAERTVKRFEAQLPGIRPYLAKCVAPAAVTPVISK